MAFNARSVRGIGGCGSIEEHYESAAMYGRQTETAIAAMSCLAEVFDSGETRLSAAQIARNRDLQLPSVAKVLTILSGANLVEGSPGPGGGYALARHPKTICIYEVFELFESTDDERNCPFGGGVCGVGEKCAIHDKLSAIQNSMNRLLHDTTFESFRQKRRRSAGASGSRQRSPQQRESYRAGKPRRTS